MNILNKLIESALDKAGKLYVEDFVIGLGLVGVRLSDGSAGVAYNLRNELLGQCEEFSEGRGESYTLLLNPGESAEKFVKAFRSPNPIARSLGLATINALLNRGDYEKGDILEFLDVKEGCKAGMIGEIGPIVMKLLEYGCEVRIFERERKRGSYPDWAITTHLEDCDLVIITASSIVNWTIEWILDRVKTDNIAIVGPSAPMVKGIFPVKVIAGAKILDSERILKELSHGVGTAGLYSWKIAEKVVLVQ